MKTIINPITKDGKVKCVHYYELCHRGKWYDAFMAIFTYEDKIYFYKVEGTDTKAKKTLIDFGEIHPLNMSHAVAALKNNII